MARVRNGMKETNNRKLRRVVQGRGGRSKALG